MSATQDLFNQVVDGLWSALDRTRSQAAGVLEGLGPEPGFGGTVLDGRLRQTLSPAAIAAGDPAVAAIIQGLTALLPNPGADGVPVSLHGFDPGDGQPRGLALVFRTPAPGTTIVAALTGAGAANIAFELAAVGSGTIGPTTLSLAAGWSLDVGGNVAGGGRLEFPRGGPAQVLDGAAPISITLTLRHAGDQTVLGPDEGPHVSVSGAAISATTGVDASGAPLVSYGFSLPDAQLSLASGDLAMVLGDMLSMPIDLELAADAVQGLSLKGGGRAALPVDVDLPGVNISAVDVGLSSTAGGVEFDFGVTFTGGLPGIPLTLTVDGLGAGFPINTGSGDLGLDPAGIHPVLPDGLGLDLSLPVVSGGGFLMTTGPGGYGGVLDLDLLELSIAAFGLLQLPVAGQPFSFVAIISVEFPPPGIQLSFGFSLNGVGGIVGVNRRLDVPALQQAVVDGSAQTLMFPVDPASHGPAIVAMMGRVFPASDGHIVVGPMLQIGWGGRILTLSVAIVVDLPNPVQFVIIGRLTAALPDPTVPLVLIQATLVGAFEISPTPTTSLLASLEGSNIAGMPLHGDLFFLVRGGDDPEFVLSAGGFHPRYVLPQGVPSGMHRMQLDITPPGFPGLRSDAYFAITSNSVQFGAHLELCDEIAGCGVDGWFNFDALFKWDPVFSFSIHCSAGVAVQVLGETLMGISFDLTLEGPSRWHAHGTGSIDLFLFSASLDFDVSWGSAQPALPPPPDLAPVLAAAFTNPDAWIGAPANDDQPMVTISAEARKLATDGHAVHPLGGVVVRERAVPFDIQISRFQQQPIPPQTWEIAAAQLAPGIDATLGSPTADQFPPGEFLDLTEDEKLQRPAFEAFKSGVALTPGAAIFPDLRAVDSSFEVELVPDIQLGVPLDLAFIHLFAETLLAIDDIHAVISLWHPPDVQKVSVLPAPPVAVASTATMQEQALASAPQSFTATLQAAQAQFGSVGQAASVQIVEQWEVAA